MIASNPCTLCGSTWHTKAFCELNRKPIKKVGKVGSNWNRIRKTFVALQKPNDEGYYECYLCHKWITLEEVTVDHVIPRSHAPWLRYNEENLKIACSLCNNSKGSKSLENFMKSH